MVWGWAVCWLLGCVPGIVKGGGSCQDFSNTEWSSSFSSDFNCQGPHKSLCESCSTVLWFPVQRFHVFLWFPIQKKLHLINSTESSGEVICWLASTSPSVAETDICCLRLLRPHLRVAKTEFFQCVLAFRLNVNAATSRWKRLNLKHPAKVEIYKISVFTLACRQGGNRV